MMTREQSMTKHLPNLQKMSREEHRRIGRMQENKKKSFTFTQDQLDKRDAAVQMESSKRALIFLMSIPLVVLRDEFGFGKKRLEKFMEKFTSLWSAYENDYIEIEELADLIEEETGLKIIKLMK